MFAKLSVLTCALTLPVAVCAFAAPAQPPAPVPVDEPGVQQGIEVQTRGPVHEAFATPTAESKASPALAKRPPANLDEMPP
ncbi:MAG TPA: hypothetical protein VE988_11430, partial [Gemmataceae bacterium]|nr:hypothetical protein [Gemmataceae bacterium]